MTWTKISDQSSTWDGESGEVGAIFLIDETTGALLIEEDSNVDLIDEESLGSPWTSITDQDTTWS